MLVKNILVIFLFNKYLKEHLKCILKNCLYIMYSKCIIMRNCFKWCMYVCVCVFLINYLMRNCFDEYIIFVQQIFEHYCII